MLAAGAASFLGTAMQWRYELQALGHPWVEKPPEVSIYRLWKKLLAFLCSGGLVSVKGAGTTGLGYTWCCILGAHTLP